MHITNEVDLPDELIQAQREGKLVIFAGSGVSKGPPANLPNFQELVDEIDPTRGNRKDYDRFLGEREDAGVPIREKTRQILGKKDIPFTPLHLALLQLFPNPEQVRIVTTNLDRLFSDAAEQAFDTSLDTYYAPALPLGREFHGLVYLHGSVDKDNSRMVLTDKDFGRAYITDGWATSFLCTLFATYAVLFVGYSHKDIVMQYLARGLAPQTKPRFALTNSLNEKLAVAENNAYWNHMRIKPVFYPCDESIGHIELTNAMQAWAKQIHMGALDHARRVQQLVTMSAIDDKSTWPSLVPEEEDYLDIALRTEDRVIHFVRKADNLAWLNWVASRRWFPKLFEPAPEKDSKDNPLPNLPPKAEEQLAQWLAHTYLSRMPGELVAILRAQQQQNRTLGHQLWHALALELGSTPSLDAMSKTVLISLLLDTSQPGWDTQRLVWTLEECRYPEDRDTALILFDYLTAPHAKLTQSYFENTSKNSALSRTDIDLALAGDEYALNEAWQNYFLPHLDETASIIEPIVTTNLLKAHVILQGAGKARENSDPISYRRDKIASTREEQPYFRESIDILIDAARDIIEALLHTNSSRAEAVIDAWANSEAMLLRRLAVHGVEKSDRTAEEKIDWILNRDLLYQPGLKSEVFSLLGIAFPSASPEAQKHLLATIDRGPHCEHVHPSQQKASDRKHYELLVWLDRHLPGHVLVTEQLENIKTRHPDFIPPKHPEYNGLRIEVENGKIISPFSSNQLYAMQPGDIVDALPNFPKVGWDEPDQEGLLREITAATTEKFNFGLALAQTLVEHEDWNSSIWQALLRGLEKANLNTEQWTQILDLLSHIQEPHASAKEIANLLLAGARNDPSFSSIQLDQVEGISDRIFESAKRDNSAITDDDLGFVALNHTCGTIAQLWMQTLFSRRRFAKDTWQGLPQSYKKRFKDILSGDSLGAGFAFIMLMQALAQIAQLDTEWTRTNLLPLLDWSANADSAKIAWHGYLHGTVLGFLEDEILPHYQSAFAHLSELPKPLQKLFSKHIALIVVHAKSNPVCEDHAWLSDFIEKATPDGRTFFARAVTEALYAVEVPQRATVWTERLSPYWDHRNSGFPPALTDDEKQDMVRWVFPLESNFEEVVRAICMTTAPNMPHRGDIYQKLLQEGFCENHPRATAQLVGHLLQSATVIYDSRPFEEMIHTLHNNGADLADLQVICSRLCHLDYPKALELADSLKGPEAT